MSTAQSTVRGPSGGSTRKIRKRPSPACGSVGASPDSTVSLRGGGAGAGGTSAEEAGAGTRSRPGRVAGDRVGSGASRKSTAARRRIAPPIARRRPARAAPAFDSVSRKGVGCPFFARVASVARTAVNVAAGSTRVSADKRLLHAPPPPPRPLRSPGSRRARDRARLRRGRRGARREVHGRGAPAEPGAAPEGGDLLAPRHDEPGPVPRLLGGAQRGGEPREDEPLRLRQAPQRRRLGEAPPEADPGPRPRRPDQGEDRRRHVARSRE